MPALAAFGGIYDASITSNPALAADVAATFMTPEWKKCYANKQQRATTIN
jgi:hypothetical protein